MGVGVLGGGGGGVCVGGGGVLSLTLRTHLYRQVQGY